MYVDVDVDGYGDVTVCVDAYVNVKGGPLMLT